MGFLYAAHKTKTNTFESVTLSWLGTHQNYWWLMTTLQPAPSIIQHEEKASNNNKDSFLITSNLIFRREKRSGGEWQTNVSVKLFGKLSFGLSATASYDSNLENAIEKPCFKAINARLIWLIGFISNWLKLLFFTIGTN